MTDGARPFDFEAKHGTEHERLVRAVIPGYEHLFKMTLAFLQAALPRSASLLIAGAGGGMELATFAASNPEWHFTGVDPSPNMLNSARRKVEDLNLSQQMYYHQGYVAELPTSKTYDAATCILVTHFLRDDGTKLNLLRDIADRLKPGAPFVIADPFGNPDLSSIQPHIPAWRQFQINNGRRIEDINHLFDQIQKAVFLVTEDRINELLFEAGYERATRFYTAFWYGGWITSKR